VRTRAWAHLHWLIPDRPLSALLTAGVVYELEANELTTGAPERSSKKSGRGCRIGAVVFVVGIGGCP
jgi:hypothetical protein